MISCILSFLQVVTHSAQRRVAHGCTKTAITPDWADYAPINVKASRSDILTAPHKRNNSSQSSDPGEALQRSTAYRPRVWPITQGILSNTPRGFLLTTYALSVSYSIGYVYIQRCNAFKLELT